MDGQFNNSADPAVGADRAHVRRHLFQHAVLEHRDPRILVKGRGMKLWDQKGTEFLDAVAGGVWAVNVGYGSTSIANAVRDQLEEMNFFADTSGNVPSVLFAEHVIENAPE